VLSTLLPGHFNLSLFGYSTILNASRGFGNHIATNVVFPTLRTVGQEGEIALSTSFSGTQG
jgi:hypothetical protein